MVFGLQCAPLMDARSAIVLGLALVGCGGSSNGGANTSPAPVAIVHVGDASPSPAVAEPAPDGGCFCDPTKPVQACCPASVDGPACHLDPANYDKSCNVDSDCVDLSLRPNWCVSDCTCDFAVFGPAGAAQYAIDQKATPVGSGAVTAPPCDCAIGIASPPCCLQGQCTHQTCGDR